MSEFWKDKKLLITGANGFLGSHMVHSLVEKGAYVTAVVSKRTQTLSPLLKEKDKHITIVPADLLDAAACVQLAKNQEMILHFAALDGNQQFKNAHAKEIFYINTTLTKNMLQAAAVSHTIERFLLMSSIEVYGQSTPHPWTEEQMTISRDEIPHTGYAQAKQLVEILAREYYEKYKFPIAIARMGNIYGPGDHGERVIPTFISRITNGEKLTFVGNGLQRKSFLYISDAIHALTSLVEQYAVCDPVNIVSEYYVTIKDLALLIEALVKKNKVENTYSFINRQDPTVSVKKAKEVIGFTEKVNLPNGLATIISL